MQTQIRLLPLERSDRDLKSLLRPIYLEVYGTIFILLNLMLLLFCKYMMLLEVTLSFLKEYFH